MGELSQLRFRRSAGHSLGEERPWPGPVCGGAGGGGGGDRPALAPLDRQEGEEVGRAMWAGVWKGGWCRPCPVEGGGCAPPRAGRSPGHSGCLQPPNHGTCRPHPPTCSCLIFSMPRAHVWGACRPQIGRRGGWGPAPAAEGPAPAPGWRCCDWAARPRSRRWLWGCCCGWGGWEREGRGAGVRPPGPLLCHPQLWCSGTYNPSM